MNKPTEYFVISEERMEHLEAIVKEMLECSCISSGRVETLKELIVKIKQYPVETFYQ